MRRKASVAVAVLAVLGLGAGCGDDEDSGGGGSAAGDVERYCDLTAELDEAGGEFFAELEDDPDATEEDFREAEQAFAEEHADTFDELREAAPEEIRDDLEILLTAIESGALGSEEAPQDVSDAETVLTDFEAENCA